MNLLRITLLITLICFLNKIDAQTSYWSKMDKHTFDNETLTRNVPQGKVYHLEIASLIAQSPQKESTKASIISLPNPENDMVDFRIWDAPIMEAGLAAKYPHIRTFQIQNISNPTEHGRLSITSNGLRAYITSPREPYFIYPDNKEKNTYAVFNKSDRIYHDDFTCEVKHEEFEPTAEVGVRNQTQIGETLREYRLAVATTGEYAQFHGGSIGETLEAIVETMNEVNVAFETDFSVRFILVDKNDELINLDAAKDPFENNSAGQMLNANRSFIDSRIGNASYDIGHVFATGGAGLASLRSNCNNSSKAQGATGIFPPEGNTFAIDYVAHELGHQLGSNHTFNNCEGNEVPSVAYEPGSGSTIMGYAGLCQSNNVQSGSDDYFHVSSLQQINAWLTGGGSTCAQETDTGNSIPTVEAGEGGFSIPIGTPFVLTAEGHDADGDESLTYCWEQFNLGARSNYGTPQGNAPSFRSFKPVTSPTRYLPKLNIVVSGSFNNSEVLPETSRDFDFQCTVRDNNPNGGGVAWDAISFEATDEAGPFVVTSQSESGIIWESNRQATVEWDVANTDQAPVNCQKVNIIMSRNLGISFDIMLAENVDNNGSATFIVPDEAVSNFARVMVQSADNVFYNVNRRQFKVVEGVVSTRDLAFENSISIFPNPSDGQFTLQLAETNNKATQIEVLDMQGRSYKAFDINASNHDFDLDVPAGLYFIKITQDKRVAYKKVVVNQ